VPSPAPAAMPTTAMNTPYSGMPAPAKAMPETVPAPPNRAAPKSGVPSFVPPGAQVLVLNQPDQAPPATPAVQQAAYVAPANNDPLPNLIAPPSPPEEMKLVTPTKPSASSSANACGGPLQIALRAYQEKSPQDANKHLAHLDPSNQQLLQKILPLAAKLGETNLPSTDPTEAAELADQLQQVVSTLRTKAALRIETLTYCRTPARPAQMGVYQPLPENHAFRGGETVELYMQVRNFSCEAKDREFLTHLTTVIEVRDDRGEVVCRYEFERDRPEAGQAPRQESFHICRFPLQGLAAGDYTLSAQITDVPTGKSAQRTLPLRVEAARRTARGNDE
jgi:hypothetical protein